MSFITKILSKQPLLTSIFVNIILFVACFFLLYPRYGTIDDSEAQLVLSGVILVPESHGELCYSHWLWGNLIASLYRLNSTVPWYGLGFLSAHFMAMVALLWTMLTLHSSRWRLLLFVLAFCVAEIPLLQVLQFTSTAVVIGGAGTILLWFSSLRGKIFPAVFGVLFVLWSSFIRWDAGLLVLCLSIVLMLHGLVLGKAYRLQTILKFGILGLLLLSTHWWQFEMVAKNKGWNDYFERLYTGIQGAVLDYDWEGYRWNEETAEIFHQKIGWSQNDYQLYKAWFMADSSVYGTRQFKQIKELLGDRPHYSKQRIKDRLLWFFHIADFPDYWIYCILAMTLCLLLYNRQNIPAMDWVLLGTVLGISFIFLALIITRQLPERVSFPSCWFVLQLFLLPAAMKDSFPPRFKWALVAVWAVLGITTIDTVYKDACKVKTAETQWNKALAALNPQPDQLYVSAACEFYEPLALPLKSLFRTQYRRFRALDFGHLSNSPTFYRQLSSMGFKNIFTEMINHDKVLFVGSHQNAYMEMYKKYMLEHYRRTIRFELYRDFPELHIAIFRVREDL